MLKLVTETVPRILQLVEAIARELGILPPLPQESPNMAVTSSIGTTGRDYSSITSWEADLDNATLYAIDKVAVGECYNDSVFDETFTIDGGGTVLLTDITLSVASGERHDGTAGTGARIVRTGAGNICVSTHGSIPHTIEWLEVDANGFNSECVKVTSGNAATIQRLIVHGTADTGNSTGIMIAHIGDAHNNIVYDHEHTAGEDAYGIRDSSGSARVVRIQNNTIHAIEANGSGNAYGWHSTNDSANKTCKNNLVTDVGGSSTGTKVDYSPSSPSNIVTATNASSDSTAPSPIAAEPVVSSAEYVSTVGGSEDLHLKSGAESIDAGTDLGTTPSGVEVDIDGRDRDASGDTWDLGADELVAAAGAAVALGVMRAGLHVGMGLGMNV